MSSCFLFLLIVAETYFDNKLCHPEKTKNQAVLGRWFCFIQNLSKPLVLRQAGKLVWQALPDKNIQYLSTFLINFYFLRRVLPRPGKLFIEKVSQKQSAIFIRS